MNNDEQYLIFLPVCMPIKGYERSLVLDIQRRVLDFIPNDLYEIYQKHNKQKISLILSHYNDEEQEIIQEYINFLVGNEYAILGSEHDAMHFAELSTEYNYWGHITNCVIKYSDLIHDNIREILDVVDKRLGCSAIQIIFEKTISIAKLDNLLENFKDITFLSHVEILLPYLPEYDSGSVKTLLLNNFIVNKIVLYCSPTEGVEDLEHTIIAYIKEDVRKMQCGMVGKECFSLNMFHITEAMHHNTCLHKKIFISPEGNIKSCPFSHEVFGNIFENDIESIIKRPSFRKYWDITKDKISVCRDCEFRYICTDCRVFLKNPDDIYSQPLHCHYNPYIAKWKGEEGYYPVKNCIFAGE